MKMNRVFLKLSGEALAGPKKTGFDEETVKEVARQVKLSVDAGIQVGIVIGGGNFWRGRTSEAIDPDKGRSDWNAGHGNELHLCVGNIPGRRDDDTDTDPL